MHRLLSAAGCDAAVAGNGAWLRYGPQVLREHAAAARYPLLVANLRALDGGQLNGTRSTTVVEAGPLRLGLIGLTAIMPEHAATFGLITPPVEPLVSQLMGELEAEGAQALIVLSHLGLKSDRALAPALAGRVLAILGGHTHDLLPEGEQVDGVWIAQTGHRAGHLGRLDFAWHDGRLAVARVSTIPVTDDIPLSPAVMAEARSVEAEGERYLDEVVGFLAEPLDFAPDRECGVANLMADVLLERMAAEVSSWPRGRPSPVRFPAVRFAAARCGTSAAHLRIPPSSSSPVPSSRRCWTGASIPHTPRNGRTPCEVMLAACYTSAEGSCAMAFCS